MMSSGDEGETAEEAMARVTRVNAFVGKQNRDDDPEFFMVKVANMTGKGKEFKVPLLASTIAAPSLGLGGGVGVHGVHGGVRGPS